MPIEKLTAKLYKFTWNKNQHSSQRVRLESLFAVGRHYGFSRGEVGYALQLLKAKDMIRYYKSVGWRAIKI